MNKRNDEVGYDRAEKGQVGHRLLVDCMNAEVNQFDFVVRGQPVGAIDRHRNPQECKIL